MKIRIRFVKKGSMQYIGHLDLMRYFQKLFRRSGFDVSYSKGFNPHQLMSFASPLGLGITTVADYLDVSLESFKVTGLTGNELSGEVLSVEEWIKRINSHSNDMVLVTGIYILEDTAKTSMSLLTAASYVITGIDEKTCRDIVDYYNNNEQIMFEKQTKKSVKEINLKEGILALSYGFNAYDEAAEDFSVRDRAYERDNAEIDDGLYIFCLSGSETNIKPDMILESYHNHISPDTAFDKYAFDIMRTDMFYGTKKYISMSVVSGE